ncbi:MAG: DUF3391 domain-containing protein [Deltaproteobacteria bacterium]|nr:DUF3391 domain-containing protein [Deltaproteobacteria bacterium]
MNAEQLSTRKWVSVLQLKPGVYVVDLDRSWFQTPFYFHRRLIKSADEIELLKKHGIRKALIDTAKGADVDAPHSIAAPAAVPSEREKSPKTNADAGPSLFETTFRPLVKELQVARTIHDEALAIAQRIFDGVGRGSPVNYPAAKSVVDDLLGSITRSPEANLLLAQMRRFEHDLFSHAVNVCVLSLVVGTLEGFENDNSALGLGALLHDVGHTRIPRNLFRRRGAYTEEERRLLEQHPKLGAALLKSSENIPNLTKRIVVEHHERIDGSGYPFALQGSQIAPLSQMVALIDTYDTMLTGRNQEALPPIEVLRQLYLQRNTGAFDSDLIERTIRCLGVYPVGSLVELNTGERGIVIATNRADSSKPTLRIISSCNGLRQLNGPIISLANRATNALEQRIVRALDPGQERSGRRPYLNFAPALAA